MYDELLAAIKQLTIAVNGVSAALAIIIVVLVLKSTNSNAEIHALRNDVNNVKAAILSLAELRSRGRTDDV